MTYNSNYRGEAFTFHIEKGLVEFLPPLQGLCYLNLENPSNSNVFLEMTISDNFEDETKQKGKKVIEAVHLQGMSRSPSRSAFRRVAV